MAFLRKGCSDGTCQKTLPSRVSLAHYTLMPSIGIRSKDRNIIEDEGDYQLSDKQAQYGDRNQYLHYWDIDNESSIP